MQMNREILRLAIPNIISNLTVPMLGMVDTALMGRMGDPAFIGAIAIGGIIFSFLYWGFGFLRMGTTGLTAQAYGAADQKEMAQTLFRAWGLACIAGLVLILAQEGIAWISFRLIEAEPRVLSLAKEYFFVRIYAAPATISLYAFHGWFLGKQNARFPLWITLIVNVANIGFNIWFVFGWDMQVEGVALGTVLAQYLGLVVAVLLWAYVDRDTLAYLTRELWQWSAIQRFVSVNRDIFIRTMCLIFAFAFFTAQSARLSTLLLAANQILLQFYNLLSYGVDGFAFAAESITGNYLGRKDQQGLQLAIRRLFVWGVGLGLVFSLTYLLGGAPLLRLFTDQETVWAATRPYMIWMGVIPVLGAVAFLWDGIYIGATATIGMRNTLLIATFLVYLPAYYLFFPLWDNHGLWLAMALFLVARAALMSYWAPKYIFRHPMLRKENF